MTDKTMKVSVYDIIPRVHIEPIILPDRAGPKNDKEDEIDLVEAYSLDTNDISSFENIINRHKGEKQ